MSNTSQRSVSNFRMPAQLALKQGQKIGSLNKLGEKVKNWKTRIFVLLKTNLLYYKTAEDKHYTGVINILNCPILRCDPSETPGNMKHCLKIQTKTRTYYLSASSEQDANEWLIALIEQSGYKIIVKQAQDPTPLEPSHRSCQIFGSIQKAIDAARGGEKILIYPGIYRENLWIEKPIQLCGYMSELERKQRSEAIKQIISQTQQQDESVQHASNEGGAYEKVAPIQNVKKSMTIEMMNHSSMNASQTIMNDPSRMSESELKKTASSRRAKNTNAAADQEMKKRIEEERVKTRAIGSTNTIIIENADDSESVIVYKANGGVISNVTLRSRLSNPSQYSIEEEKPLSSCLEMDNGGLTLKGVTISSAECGSGILATNKSILILMECIISQCRDMGVWLMDRTQCTISRSRIVSCKVDAIRVSGESTLHKLSHTDMLGSGLNGLCVCDRALCSSMHSCQISQSVANNICVQNEARIRRVVGCTLTNSSEFGILFSNIPTRGLSEEDIICKLTNNKIENNVLGDVYIEHLDYMGRFVKKYVRRKKKEVVK
ncbi:hypothetical protein C9374_004993 [Naegleria lovaniensis]|uniref:PH domain-containing protein n=1 Tax=Naegleria lovaniensis TaxID=51637 RepID=A0AA88GL79_NAELO|nr:uncharacterized protein C9374_004993 [Naegleria lovaniensis]KAG2383026.1 hypothetical protein C9374_004993 [Naegleria lovaniensis]